MLPRLVHVCLFHLLHDTVFGSSDLARSSVSSFSGSLGRLTSLTRDLARASENSCAAFGTRARILGAPGLSTRNKDATGGPWPYYSHNLRNRSGASLTPSPYWWVVGSVVKWQVERRTTKSAGCTKRSEVYLTR